MTSGNFMLKVSTMHFLVDFVAVAVKAITLTHSGIMLRISPK